MKISQKVKVWPKRVVPEPEVHKLEGEFFHDGLDVFAGHGEYRPDCVTHSRTWRGSDCTTVAQDSQWWIDQAAAGLPGDYYEDAIR